MNEYFLLATDIAEILHVSESKAYKMVQQWNKELKSKGYEVVRGRVPRRYALERLGVKA